MAHTGEPRDTAFHVARQIRLHERRAAARSSPARDGSPALAMHGILTLATAKEARAIFETFAGRT